MRISEALHGVMRLGVDASALIDLIDSVPRSAQAWRGVLSRTQAGDLVLVSSSVLLVEVIATGDDMAIEASRVEAALSRLEMVDLGQEIARLAASMRRDYGLETPDAIHIATALAARCEAFLTADRDFLRVSGYPLPWAPSRTLKIIVAQELSA